MAMSGNQRNQSIMGMGTSREKMSISGPHGIGVKDYLFSIDPLMAGDEILAKCCTMAPDNYELEMLPEIVTWIKRENMDIKFSIYFGIFHFRTDEDKVKFILRWL